MPVFNLFYKIMKSHLAKNLIFFGIYVALVVMMSNAGSKTYTSSFEAHEYDIVVQDLDNSHSSQALVSYLDSVHDINILADYSQENIQDNLFYQRISFSLVIPENFEKDLLDGKSKDLYTYSARKDSPASYFLTEQIDSYINSLYLYNKGGFSLEESIGLTNETFMDNTNTQVIEFEKLGSNTNNGLFFYFQYLPYTMLMVICATLSPIMMILHNPELNARMEVSNISRKQRNLQLGFACSTFTILAWLLFMIVSIVFFGSDVYASENGRLLVLNSFVFTLVATGIALIVGNFDLKGSAIDLVTNIVSLGMSFLCGIFVPQYFLGSGVLTVARFLPAYWYIRILNMLSGASSEVFSMDSYWSYLGIESMFIVAIFAVFMVVSSRKKVA